MNTVGLRNAQWFKSSYSNGIGTCVEVAHLGHLVAARDSKLPDTGPVMATEPGAWQVFVTGVSAGALDAS